MTKKTLLNVSFVVIMATAAWVTLELMKAWERSHDIGGEGDQVHHEAFYLEGDQDGELELK